MTLREAIAARQRTGAVVTYIGVVWVVAVLILTNADPPWVFVAIPGVLVFAVGALYLNFRVHCPSCHGPIGRAIGSSGGPFTISRRIRFCPLCGVALDTEVETNRVV
jgi:hypothetical protein